ncbi:prepilin-type N-terminal cleavage/methylation domain-containing protein [Bhargavaea ginsengi]|uniref:Prepilin-type N-terminal cleavage/methylation domain-containing protein n=1 Tax=Bhargavaea ginsengi TaxID=426757 RepID=A0A1H6XK91_9BACL|nr:prepilin-type N-terminal cleavage/methylation domain-containing protein [Bhargavaea ginsengi]SEJ25270.1 prepilin-type N-terminal cleavage/methylation domain-containing protein [Bhargavaea ginsengi]
MKKQAIERNEKGLTLVEVLAALVIIAIIILGISAFFSTSVKTTDTTEKLLDASYVNQRFMEEVYRVTESQEHGAWETELLNAGWEKPGNQERYLKDSSGYYIELTVSESAAGSSLYNILMKVYEDSTYTKLVSQMETRRQG